MKRSIAVMILICTLLTGIPALAVEYGAELNPEKKAYNQSFADVETGHWAFEYIENLVERGAISGYPDGKFRPSNNVTRAEFSKIMVMAAGLSPVQTQNQSFHDVPATHWCHPYLEVSKDYMTGYTVGSQYLYKPDENALREDIAVAVVKLKGYDVRFADLSMLEAMFNDCSTISEALKPYVALAVENGLISGYPDETFRAQATITRAEASAILWRAFQYGSDNKGVVSPGGTQPTVDPTSPTTAIEQPNSSPGTTDPSGGVTSATDPTNATQPIAQAKPSKVDTIARAGNNVRNLTLNRNNDLYFIQGDSVMKIQGGAPVELFNGSELTFTISDKELLTEIWGVSEDHAELGRYIKGSDSVTFDGFELVDLILDDSSGKMLLLGYFPGIETQYSCSEYGYRYSDKICVIDVDSGTVVQEYWNWYSNRAFPSDTRLSIGADQQVVYLNGSLVFHLESSQRSFGDSSNNWMPEYYALSLNQGLDNSSKLTTYAAKTQVSSGVHAMTSYSTAYNGKLTVLLVNGSYDVPIYIAQYNLAAKSYDLYPIAYEYAYSATSGYCSLGNAFYHNTQLGLVKLTLSTGKSGSTREVLLEMDDIEVMDGTALSIDDEIIMIDEQNIIFYDSSARLIRQISPNG